MINVMKLVHLAICMGIFIISIVASMFVLGVLGGMLGLVCAALVLPIGVIVSLGYLALVVEDMIEVE